MNILCLNLATAIKMSILSVTLWYIIIFFSSWGRYKYIFLWLCCDLPQLSCSLSHTFAHMHCNLPLLH